MKAKPESATDRAERQVKVVAVRNRIVPPTPPNELPYIHEINPEWDEDDLQSILDEVDEMVELSRVVKEAEERLKSIKADLIGTAQGYGVKGFRTDTVKVHVSAQSRPFLNKDKLLQHIPVSVLESCYDTGLEFYVCRVEEIKTKPLP